MASEDRVTKEEGPQLLSSERSDLFSRGAQTGRQGPCFLSSQGMAKAALVNQKHRQLVLLIVRKNPLRVGGNIMALAAGETTLKY
jgi:hypothetical protein